MPNISQFSHSVRELKRENYRFFAKFHVYLFRKKNRQKNCKKFGKIHFSLEPFLCLIGAIVNIALYLCHWIMPMRNLRKVPHGGMGVEEWLKREGMGVLEERERGISQFVMLDVLLTCWKNFNCTVNRIVNHSIKFFPSHLQSSNCTVVSTASNSVQ